MSALGGKLPLALHCEDRFLPVMKKGAGVLPIVILSACAAQSNRNDPMLSFRMLDADRNGLVSTSEWKGSLDTATAQLPSGPSAEEARCRGMKLFESLDIDRDGQLSATEWKHGKFESGADVCPSPLIP